MMRLRISIGLLALIPIMFGAISAEQAIVQSSTEQKSADSNLVLAQGPVAQPQTEDDRPTFFDGIRGIIGDSPAFDDNDATESLVESLNRAEKAYKEIRQSNREAIRGMNRQVRVGTARQSPHIVVITIPQLRFDQLTSMTRLSGIRNSGMTFTNYYAPADNLTSSRWSYLTGNLAAKSPAEGRLNRKESLAESLWQAGYETTLIGTWASNQHPVELGYDHWTGFPSSSGVVARYPEFFFTQTTRAKIMSDSDSAQSTSHQLITDEVTSFLKRHQRSSRQFYLHVGIPFLQGVKSEENIQEVDNAIGQIVDSLNTLGLAGRVCLIVTGETSHQIAADVDKNLPVVDEKLTYSKSGTNEGNLRTPLIVFWAGRAKRGSVSDFPCTGIDLLPTLMYVAAARKTPQGIDGVSLISEIQGSDLDVERLLYWKMKDGDQVARRGRWKVILREGQKQLELYDLERDPSESTNVAKKHPDIVDSFVVDSNPQQPLDSQTL